MPHQLLATGIISLESTPCAISPFVTNMRLVQHRLINRQLLDVILSQFNSRVNVFNSNDVVFAGVFADLHFDHHQVDFAIVF